MFKIPVLGDSAIIMLLLPFPFKQLTNEQDNIGRIKLDTENSFLIVSSRKSIEVDVTLPNGWSTDDSTQVTCEY